MSDAQGSSSVGDAGLLLLCCSSLPVHSSSPLCVLCCVVCVVLVWVQVVDHDGNNIGDVCKIKPCPDDISDLRQAVKIKFSPDLDYTIASVLKVFADGDTEKINPLAGNVDVPTSTYDKPLIVVAPAKEAQGKALLPNNPTLVILFSHCPSPTHRRVTNTPTPRTSTSIHVPLPLHI